MIPICLKLTQRIAYLTAISLPLLLLFPLQARPANTLGNSTPNTQPNAGSLQQQIERQKELELNLLKIAPLKELESPEPVKTPSGPFVTLKEFKFVCNNIYTSTQLSALLDSYIGHPIQFYDIQGAASKVADFYRQSGWVVKASLPTQDIVYGVVTIQIIEASFGGVKFDGTPSKKVNLNRIVSTIYSAQTPGTPLNAKSIERGLALVNELGGVTVQGNLAEGRGEGQTDLIVTVTDSSRMTGELGSDNTGARSTGSNRITTSLSLHSLMGEGDSTDLYAISTAGSEYVRLSESLPIGYAGVKMGFNASYLNYRLVAQDFSSLNANGTSSIYGLEGSYPFVKTRSSTLTAALSVERKRYLNNSQGVISSDYTNTPISISLNGSNSDGTLWGARNSGSLTLSAGGINLSRSPNQATDASTTKTAGQYTKSRYFVSREQELPVGFSIYSSLSGQWTNRNLDSSEKFFLGGVNGVRSYPTSEAGGSLGQLGTVELRNHFWGGLTLTGFYDYGRVLINPDNNFSGASALNQYSLKGAGLVLSYQTNSGASIKATVAKRIGDNPNPTSTGLDQDGSLVKSRIWLNANLPF